MSQSFVSDLVSSKLSYLRVSCKLKNILSVPTTDHLNSTTLLVSEKVKYLSCHCLGKFPFLQSSVALFTPAQMIKHFRHIEHTRSWNTCTVARQVGTVINQIWCLEGAGRHLPFCETEIRIWYWNIRIMVVRWAHIYTDLTKKTLNRVKEVMAATLT